MEKKILAEYVDHGYGFPVVLENVPMCKVDGAWTPYINYNNLSRELLRSLSELPARLTGDHVRFIRESFGMTLQQFSDRLEVTHPAVLKWESKRSKPTGMTWSTEKDIRLLIALHVRRSKSAFLELYKSLAQATPETSITLSFPAKAVARKK